MHTHRCFDGNLEIVQILLKEGAEMGTEDGVTSPLHHCAIHGHDDCLAALLEHYSGSINLLDSEGSTPLHKVGSILALACKKKRPAPPEDDDVAPSVSIHAGSIFWTRVLREAPDWSRG